MINLQRLYKEFVRLVGIASPSRKEGRLVDYLRQALAELGLEVCLDGSAIRTGSQTGNLVAFLPGRPPRLPLLLNAHLDTVSPGEGIQPLFSSGRFYTDGRTILAADDKSGIAAILEALRSVREGNAPFCTVGVVFTVCEEIGLLGAKYLDYSLLRGFRFCLSLDQLDAQAIVHRAPTANRLKFTLWGKEAHAGVAPEKGINAIQLASRAISRLRLGRIDPETTANIGLIQGGTATNIVPAKVVVEGEARSHAPEKLAAQTEHMRAVFREVVVEVPQQDGLPKVEEEITLDYPLMRVEVESPLIQLVQQAAGLQGRRLKLASTGGGSDANIFNGQGIETVVLGTGMREAHTTRESLIFAELCQTAELLVHILRLNVQ